MKWYHWTGIEAFCKIMENEMFLSSIERLKLSARLNGFSDTDADELIKKQFAEEQENNPREYFRLSHVFFTSDLKRRPESAGDNVVMGLELNCSPNYGERLAIPKASTEGLIDVGAKRIYVPTTEEILRSFHGGKYRHVAVYEL